MADRGDFQAAKGLAALDQHQVRAWTSWHRWTILAMLAHAFLAVTAAAEHTTHAVSATNAPSRMPPAASSAGAHTWSGMSRSVSPIPSGRVNPTV